MASHTQPLTAGSDIGTVHPYCSSWSAHCVSPILGYFVAKCAINPTHTHGIGRGR